ncbi:hypothetical protein HK100_002848 [Physocladia obscura]|uniref:F-box domain-containing protein n=1 Tax=Physocladia obscura TaxID=109957 RepID=A0AAD5SXK9_9FUNG|nr:hypothetical protein HK100_002848 [Physocladia obscura]
MKLHNKDKLNVLRALRDIHRRLERIEDQLREHTMTTTTAILPPNNININNQNHTNNTAPDSPHVSNSDQSALNATSSIQQSHSDVQLEVASLSLLPVEVVARIFTLLSPVDALRLSRLSRAFRSLVSSTTFARRCIQNHVNLLNQVLPNLDSSPLVVIQQQSSLPVILHQPQQPPPSPTTTIIVSWLPPPKQDQLRLDAAWFLWSSSPIYKPWQEAYAKLSLSSRTSIDVHTLPTFPIHTPTTTTPITTIIAATNIDSTSTSANGGIPIPTSINNLTSLTTLSLHRANLTGQIPPQIGHLTALTTLRLDDNRLSGRIPPDLGNCVRLVHLCLDSNMLSGTVPAEFGRLVHLRLLNLRRNRLHGPVPAELRNLKKLQTLYLGLRPISFLEAAAAVLHSINESAVSVVDEAAAYRGLFGGGGSDDGDVVTIATTITKDFEDVSLTIPAQIPVDSNVWNLLRRDGLRRCK